MYVINSGYKTWRRRYLTFEPMDDESTQILNFKAKLISDYPEDRRRQFMISYYLCDKTMAIFEAAVPNSPSPLPGILISVES